MEQTSDLHFHFQPGFYDITAGCLPCQCNQGGSLSQVCDQSSNDAQCPCIPNVESTTCRVPTAGNFSKALDDIIFEAEEAILAGVNITPNAIDDVYYEICITGISCAYSATWNYRTIYW